MELVFYHLQRHVSVLLPKVSDLRKKSATKHTGNTYALEGNALVTSVDGGSLAKLGGEKMID